MALADFLGMDSTLGAPLTPDQLAALPYLNVPGGSTPAPSPQTASTQAASTPAAPPAGTPSKLRNFLGAIGDALLVAHGADPLYRQRVITQQTQGALQNYLGDPQGAVANLMKVNAPLGIQLLQANAKARYDYERGLPPELRDLNAMGIDASSPEGQSLLSSKLGKSPVAGIAEYQFYKQNGGTLPFGDFLRLIHPPAGVISQEVPSGSSPPAQPALRLNPETGQWEPE